jgi:Protein of unknown function (DUF2971)
MLSDGAPPIFDIDHMRSISEEVIQQINAMMQATRILCVTTQINSEKMWTQYAENHEGIALRIEPSLEKDSKFQRFRPVSYREKRPPLFESADEFIAGAFWGNREARLREKNDKIICTKTLNWAHEREYRSAIPLRKNEEPWDTVPYHPEEITELYLGLEMEEANAGRVISMALAINPKIAIYKVKRTPDGILGFDRRSNSA